jgi:hypothetical protein
LSAEPDITHPLVLLVRERDQRAAVIAIGEDCRDDLGPDSSIEAAGFNLLLVHLDEVLATRDTSEPLRITGQGLEWPQTLRQSQPWSSTGALRERAAVSTLGVTMVASSPLALSQAVRHPAMSASS